MAADVVPTIRYADAGSAVRWLTEVAGLTARNVATGPDGVVAHAEMAWRDGVVMVSSRATEPSPFDTGKTVLYLVADDVDAHHDRAVATGADVVMELTDQDYGSREYAVRDPEGNVWCFGTYQPQP